MAANTENMESTLQPEQSGEEKRIRAHITQIARKAHLAAESGGKDIIYELAVAALVPLVGPDAVHTCEPLKSSEARDWAETCISDAIYKQ